MKLVNAAGIAVCAAAVLACQASRPVAATSDPQTVDGVQRTEATLRELGRVVDRYRDEKGRLPEQLEQLVLDHYLDDVPRDAWGQRFHYTLGSKYPKYYSIASIGVRGVPMIWLHRIPPEAPVIGPSSTAQGSP